MKLSIDHWWYGEKRSRLTSVLAGIEPFKRIEGLLCFLRAEGDKPVLGVLGMRGANRQGEAIDDEDKGASGSWMTHPADIVLGIFGEHLAVRPVAHAVEAGFALDDESNSIAPCQGREVLVYVVEHLGVGFGGVFDPLVVPGRFTLEERVVRVRTHDAEQRVLERLRPWNPSLLLNARAGIPAALSVSAAARNSSTDMVSPTSMPLSSMTDLLYQNPLPR